MRSLSSSALVALTFFFFSSLSACAPYAADASADNQLALAGFTAHAANTTARYAMMNLLPPNRMAYRREGDDIVLLYADPLYCGCVYMGDRGAYAAWIATHKITPLQERQMTAEIAQDPGWDWSVWSPQADPPEVRAQRGEQFGAVSGQRTMQ